MEIVIPPREDLSPAEQAVFHILERVIQDRQLSWHMIGTETLRKVLIAEAARVGTTDKVIEQQMLGRMHKWDEYLKQKGEDIRPREVVLEAEVEELREQVDDDGDDFDSDLDYEPEVTRESDSCLYEDCGQRLYHPEEQRTGLCDDCLRETMRRRNLVTH